MQAHENRLIQALSPENRSTLLDAADPRSLKQGTVLVEPDEPNRYVYFLTSGLASQIVTVRDGGSADVGLIGVEGMAGGTALLGSVLPLSRCLMQTDGTVLRVAFDTMQRLFAVSPELRGCVLELMQYQMITLNQIVACNTLHRASERLARWLLMASDRMGSETITLTQESIAAMLGTRRTTVALVAGSLQRSGMIRYSRGVVRILDRQQLQDAACDCYAVITRLSDNLYRRSPSPFTRTYGNAQDGL